MSGMKTYKVRCVRTNRLRGFGEVVLPHHPSVSDKADSASRLLREERYCAVDGLQQEPFDPGLIPEIGASAADVERWCRATHDLFEGVQTFHRWASTTLERLRNPPPAYRRILSWSKNLRITGPPGPDRTGTAPTRRPAHAIPGRLAATAQRTVHRPPRLRRADQRPDHSCPRHAEHPGTRAQTRTTLGAESPATRTGGTTSGHATSRSRNPTRPCRPTGHPGTRKPVTRPPSGRDTALTPPSSARLDAVSPGRRDGIDWSPAARPTAMSRCRVRVACSGDGLDLLHEGVEGLVLLGVVQQRSAGRRPGRLRRWRQERAEAPAPDPLRTRRSRGREARRAL